MLTGKQYLNLDDLQQNQDKKKAERIQKKKHLKSFVDQLYGRFSDLHNRVGDQMDTIMLDKEKRMNFLKLIYQKLKANNQSVDKESLKVFSKLMQSFTNVKTVETVLQQDVSDVDQRKFCQSVRPFFDQLKDIYKLELSKNQRVILVSNNPNLTVKFNLDQLKILNLAKGTKSIMSFNFNTNRMLVNDQPVNAFHLSIVTVMINLIEDLLQKGKFELRA